MCVCVCLWESDKYTGSDCMTSSINRYDHQFWLFVHHSADASSTSVHWHWCAPKMIGGGGWWHLFKPIWYNNGCILPLFYFFFFGRDLSSSYIEIGCPTHAHIAQPTCHLESWCAETTNSNIERERNHHPLLLSIMVFALDCFRDNDDLVVFGCFFLPSRGWSFDIF